jgi:hypothetical protein
MKISVVAAAFGFGLLAWGAAFATETVANAAATAPTPTATMKPDKAAMQARAQECSKEAEVQGLMHKERKKFREKCMKGAK